MSSLNNLIYNIVEDYLDNIQLGLPCRIEKFDKEKMRADIQPYLKDKNYNIEDSEEVEYPIITDIPVCVTQLGNYYIRPDYKKDDLVWVTFSSNDIYDALEKQKRLKSPSSFLLHNACVVGGILSNKDTAPTEFSNEDGLLIGHKDGNSYVVFADNNITFKFDGGSTTYKLEKNKLTDNYNNTIEFSSTSVKINSNFEVSQ